MLFSKYVTDVFFHIVFAFSSIRDDLSACGTTGRTLVTPEALECALVERTAETLHAGEWRLHSAVQQSVAVVPYTQAESIKAAKATLAVLSTYLGVTELAQLGQNYLGPTACRHIIVH